ncbi:MULTISPECIES: DUF1329 domain-containing protein [Pseudomonas]|uniref:DUF1329 domain-containing protein n=1 Tax=Pseudomonas putida TaxID=303 RepID=A0A1B2F6M2_PSEPU|nr:MULTISPECIES: DUF1329 domain-containing protein [Pseudomonas]ANY87793.1 hypothetical protein IEC33019_2239 [Pseudomonas putida]MCL8304769.1 DUF1329 domain-containing protein [Pseudomonas putida]
MKTMLRAASLSGLATAVLLALSGQAFAQITADQAARLGKDLTPLGGEMAGNSDGSIPSYTGGLAQPPVGWSATGGYSDPFASEKPLFTITAANLAQYKDKVTPGMQALLTKYPNFKMPVYPTHRTAMVPAVIAAKVKQEAPNVQLNGFGVSNLNGTTTPFPIPKNGLEAIWNHNLRYLGGGLQRTYASFPVRGSGDYYTVRIQENRVFDPNMDTSSENRLLNYSARFISPATLAGTVQLVHEPIDQVKEVRSAWIYNVGQRRVRRAPDLAYDNVNDGTEGLRVTDDFDGYNGAPDRFDWKLVGKQEMYVPYNDYKLGSKEVKYKDILTPNTPNPDLMRYELHRVWVVEGTLRKDAKHVYGKRVMYLDEDSWTVLASDAYDTRGILWRIGVHPLVQFYDAQVPWYRANIWHDLSNGSYYLAGLANEESQPWTFGIKGRFVDFQPDALRRMGK